MIEITLVGIILFMKLYIATWIVICGLAVGMAPKALQYVRFISAEYEFANKISTGELTPEEIEKMYAQKSIELKQIQQAGVQP